MKQEKRDGTSKDPYLAFRKRTEKMQTRKVCVQSFVTFVYRQVCVRSYVYVTVCDVGVVFVPTRPFLNSVQKNATLGEVVIIIIIIIIITLKGLLCSGGYAL